MWIKLLPEAGGCNLMFLPEAAGGGQNFCRRLGSSMSGTIEMHAAARPNSMQRASCGKSSGPASKPMYGGHKERAIPLIDTRAYTGRKGGGFWMETMPSGCSRNPQVLVHRSPAGHKLFQFVTGHFQIVPEQVIHRGVARNCSQQCPQLI